MPSRREWERSKLAVSSETPPVRKFCLQPSRPPISGGPADSEDVAVYWERVIDPSVGEAESDVGIS